MADVADYADRLRETLLATALVPLAGFATASSLAAGVAGADDEVWRRRCGQHRARALHRRPPRHGPWQAGFRLERLALDLLESARSFVRSMVRLPADTGVYFTGESGGAFQRAARPDPAGGREEPDRLRGYPAPATPPGSGSASRPCPGRSRTAPAHRAESRVQACAQQARARAGEAGAGQPARGAGAGDARRESPQAGGQGAPEREPEGACEPGLSTRRSPSDSPRPEPRPGCSCDCRKCCAKRRPRRRDRRNRSRA